MNFTKEERIWIVNAVRECDKYILKEIEEGRNIEGSEFVMDLHKKLNDWLK
jgi:hypothetical protein